ncbi:hypothetical protein R0135_14215 [Congregibacter variabilis]|uniref:Uncharacterized protein n=1 Tax=Congregibacter variabilis TaxID=3081200 RepID=A0ABZ0I0A9_9GAMM|nr:hypothetical protein R0135_14215 [Congregibacter sp. IMCC43200]
MRDLLLSLICVVSFVTLSTNVEAQSSMSVRYGSITGVEVTTKESAVARNAIIGGVIGAVVEDSFSGALGGATAGFAITSILEGDRRVYLYTLLMDDDQTMSVAIKRPDLAIGHCAALEQDGKHANLRPVSAVHCVKDNTDAHEDHRLDIAQKCKAARQRLSTGGTAQEIDSALHDMRAYCD